MSEINLQPIDLKGINILVIDDVDDATLFLSSYLTRRGALVSSASDGLQGLQLYKKQRPDIIITDIRMPKMDGISLATEIRAHDYDTPIIFLTAYSEIELLQRCISLEAAEYVIKPVKQATLQQALQNSIEKLSRIQIRNQAMTTLNSALEELRSEKQQLSTMVAKLFDNDKHMAVQAFQSESEEVSGNFHCTVQHNSSLYVLLANGSGNGIPAVLPAIELPKHFRKLANRGLSLSRIADELNHHLFEQKLENHFIAASLLRIDIVSNLIEVINCENPDVLIIDGQGSALHSFPSNHAAWGNVDGDDFLPNLQQYRYQESVKVYMPSDGFTKAMGTVTNQPWEAVFAEIAKDQSASTLTALEQWWNTIPTEQQIDDATVLEIDLQSLDFKESDAAKLSAQSSKNYKELAVLLVEHDKEALNFLTELLEKKVGMVFKSDNSEEGLRLFNAHRPGMIIADIGLPGMNGLTLTERIRKVDGNVPIILINENGSESFVKAQKLETLLELNINKFLPDPLNTQNLLDAIEFCFNQFDTLLSLNISASIFMTSPLAISVANVERNMIAVNPAFTQITGYSSEEVLGCNPRILSSGRHDSNFYKQLWDTINSTGSWCGEIMNRRKNGELFLEWINITAIYNNNGEVSHYISIFSDATQRISNEKKLRHLAYHDPLTNLPNRTLFFDRLVQALAHAQRDSSVLAVIYLDIDHFKYINDTLGHGIGDTLICEVANALQSSLRESDTVCRLGGDEFAILMTEINHEKMINYLADKLFNAVSRTYTIDDHDLHIGVSMGVSHYPADGNTPEILLKRADNAMYQAKKDGRGRFRIFNQKMEQKAERYIQIQQGLHRALVNDEFAIHYQPKFSSCDSRTVGLEALSRWNHPTWGLVSPSEFIPIAEDSEFIIKLGDWLVEQVCMDLAEWIANGVTAVPVSINISPAQFHRGNVLESLTKSLDKYQLPTSLLQIELTEGIVMNTKPNIVKQLQDIKDLGIKISIDDFGTGYSSMSYLQTLPIDELKIDRSFIKEITDENCLSDNKITAIPSTIIQLANRLCLKLVAEGVETEVQRNFLYENGCNIMQGYLFSHPIDKESITKWLTNECDGGDTILA